MKKAYNDDGLPLLAPYQPSSPFKSFDGDDYIFRLTAVEPTHPPASLADVASKVDADLRLQAMHDSAGTPPAPLLASAIKDKNLGDAAKAAGVPLLSVGPLQNSNNNVDTPGIKFESPTAQSQFVRGLLAAAVARE